MDFYIAYFPIIKLFLGTFLFIGLVLLIKSKKFKIALIYLIMLLITLWYSPVKYDGTQSKTYHKQQIKKVSKVYTTVDSTPVITVKKSFKEQMAEETLRSKKANKRIDNEIIK